MSIVVLSESLSCEVSLSVSLVYEVSQKCCVHDKCSL